MVKNILILTDFSEGSWDAICFVMKFLGNGETNINLLQTYQKPEVRHTNVRDIVPILQKISNDELEQLRRKIFEQFIIPKRKVKSLSIEGSLGSLLQNQLNLNNIDSIVVGLHSSIPDTRFSIRRKISRIIKWSSHPLFIIPNKLSEPEFNKITFVTDIYNQPSAKVLDKLRYLESLVKSEIHILFVDKNDTDDIPENIKSNIIKHLFGIRVTTNYLHNASINLVQNYKDFASRNLVVIERTNYQKFWKILLKKFHLSLNSPHGIPLLLIVP